VAKKLKDIGVIDREIAGLEKDEKELTKAGMTACLARIAREKINLLVKEKKAVLKELARRRGELSDEDEEEQRW